MAFIVWRNTEGDTEGLINGARGIYPDRVSCPVEDGEDDLVIEYAFDASTEDIRSLQLSADKKTITNKYPGKTLAEQQALIMDAVVARNLEHRKNSAKGRVSAWTGELLENMDWKTQRAEEQDFLAGNNAKMTALAAERKKIRDDGNAHQAKVDALTTEEDVLAFDARYTSQDSVGFGPNRSDSY
tara:strand:- start:66 stop:620 length:555 start_codon:yes stop_codon:yes gene_type:complete